MTKSERTTYRKRLEEMIQRLSHERSELRGQLLRVPDAAADPADTSLPAEDLRHESADSEVARVVLDTEESLLDECRAAISRLEQGTFGTCEQCTRPISRARLEALPHARLCARCAKKRDAAISRGA